MKIARTFAALLLGSAFVAGCSKREESRPSGPSAGEAPSTAQPSSSTSVSKKAEGRRPRRAVPVERLLPEETLAFVSVDDVTRAKSDLVETALASARERARRTKCATNLKQIGYGCHLYSGDFNEKFPPDLGTLSPKYIPDRRVFECASKPGAPAYGYVSGLAATGGSRWVLAFDKEENHSGDGRNVLYIGCNVEWVTEPRFKGDLATTIREAAAKGFRLKVLGAEETPEPPPGPEDIF